VVHRSLPTPDPSPGRSREPSARAETGVPADGLSVELRARIALVIDDLGREPTDLDRLDALGVPISFAVLPFESHTPEIVAELRRRQREILCHLPMQPANGKNPGPGALVEGMPKEQLRRLSLAALQRVPGAVGVNNHMGSELTADADAMRVILGVIGEAGLFFLDSRTSAASVGYRTARSLGVPTAERQVFLDTDPSPVAIEKQLTRLVDLASERGAAIAIGHPYDSTLEVLARQLPRLTATGIEFVPVSYLVERPAEVF